MKAIIRLTETTLQAAASGCTLTFRIDKDGSEIGTVYYLSTSLNRLEKLQKVQAAFMQVVDEELDLFEFERHPNGECTLRLCTKDGHSLSAVMSDVVERVPFVVPA